MKKLVLLLCGLLSLTESALASGLVGVTSDELQSMLEKGAIVVDVRTPKEWAATGIIAGSHLLTYFDESGQYDQNAWLKSLQPLLGKRDRPIVLVCRSGNRSGMVGKMMTSEAGFDRVFHLEKGIREWTSQGRPLAQVVSALQNPSGKRAP